MALNRALFSQLFHTGSRGGGGVLVGKGDAILQKCCAPALSNNFASDRGRVFFGGGGAFISKPRKQKKSEMRYLFTM